MNEDDINTNDHAAHLSDDAVNEYRFNRGTFLKGAVAAGVLAGVPLGMEEAFAATKIKTGGKLRLGTIGTSKESYDPGNPVGVVDNIRTAQVLDSLGEQRWNSTIITPALAESWVPNKRRDQWKVKLKTGIHFHNGKSLTADDVLASYQHFSLSKGKALIQLIDLQRTKKLDKHTILFQLTAPYGLFDTLLTVRILPASNTTFTAAEFIGTGPFKVGQISPGQLTTLIRNKNYWNSPLPYLSELDLVSFNDATAKVNALVAGQVDAVDGLQATQIDQVRGAGYKVLRGAGGVWTPLVMDTTMAPFTDNRVRMAFKLIANRPLMLRNALGGFGTIGNDYWGLGSQGYPTPGKQIPQRRQDIAKAKSLLKAAGHAGLTVTLESADIGLGALASALIFAQEAAKAGVTVNVRTSPANTYYSGPYFKVPFYQSNWGPHTIENQSAQCVEGGFQETHWTNAKYISLIRKARTTTSNKERAHLYLQAQTILSNEGGYIIWGYQNSLDAYSPKFTGFATKVAARAFGGFDFRKIHRV